jgi:hypothetical protein
LIKRRGRRVSKRETIADYENQLNQLLDKLSVPSPDQEEFEEDPEQIKAFVRIALANVARDRLDEWVDIGPWLQPPLPEGDDQLASREGPNE